MSWQTSMMSLELIASWYLLRISRKRDMCVPFFLGSETYMLNVATVDRFGPAGRVEGDGVADALDADLADRHPAGVLGALDVGHGLLAVGSIGLVEAGVSGMIIFAGVSRRGKQ